jgi:hypothetical protein
VGLWFEVWIGLRWAADDCRPGVVLQEPFVKDQSGLGCSIAHRVTPLRGACYPRPKIEWLLSALSSEEEGEHQRADDVALELIVDE